MLTVNAPQFTPAEQKDILLRAQGTAVFDFTLAVSGANTQVNVYGTTATVPVESNQVDTRLSQEKIEDTPVLERKITTLPLLNTNQNRPAVISSPVDPGALYNGTFGQTLFRAL